MISVILPAWNERENLFSLLSKILDIPEVVELILVDDASTDGTEKAWIQWQHQHKAKVNPRFLQQRIGLAPSVLLGVRASTCEWILIRDSDWNHDIHDISRLIERAKLHPEMKVVSASRYKSILNALRNIYRINDIFSISCNGCLRMKFGKITDWTYGYFLVRRDFLQSLPLDWIFRGRGEYMLRFFRTIRSQNVSFQEISTMVQSRGGGTSSTNVWKHGRAYWRALGEKMPSEISARH